MPYEVRFCHQWHSFMLHTKSDLKCRRSTKIRVLLSVLCNSAFEEYLASVIDEWMSMEHWWYDTDGGKRSIQRKTCHSATLSIHKSHMNWPGTDLRPQSDLWFSKWHWDRLLCKMPFHRSPTFIHPSIHLSSSRWTVDTSQAVFQSEFVPPNHENKKKWKLTNTYFGQDPSSTANNVKAWQFDISKQRHIIWPHFLTVFHTKVSEGVLCNSPQYVLRRFSRRERVPPLIRWFTDTLQAITSQEISISTYGMAHM